MTLLKEQPSTVQRKFRVHYLLLSFFVPFIILILALIALHITPFGNHSLAITDAKFYLNGEMWFSRLLKGQENILYSFNNGLGGNEWSIFAWGGFSFGNFLSVIATLETIPSVFTWICVVNLAICGLTMYILLSYVNSGNSIGNLMFSTSYALCGFNVVNCYQIGFLLGPGLLPLVILGLILIFRGKTPLLYIFSLAFCAFFNFYFAFHLCVISLVFYLAYISVYNKDLKGKQRGLFLRWFVASLIGGLLAAPMWLPTLKAYSGGGRLNQTGIFEYKFKENMPFIQIFSKLFSGANSTDELVSGLPNIFCGILVLALVVLYFIDKKNDVRRKRAAGIVLVFYLLSFYIRAFTLAMHGGTHTNWFPYRYSYVFSFLLICLAVEEFRQIGEWKDEDIRKCGVALFLAAILVFSTSYEFISGGTIVLDFTILLLMWIGFRFYKTRPDKAPLRTFSLLLLILVGINLYANFIVSTKKVQDWELDLNEYNKNILVSGAMVGALNLSEESFFRMEKDISESDSVGADSLLYNYNGVSHSGPAERMFIHKGLCRLGINWFDMRHWYSEGVPAATDSLLGLKYLISERDLTEEKGFEKKIEMEGTRIYQNPYALSPAILSNADIAELELGNNVFENLNVVWKEMTGKKKNIFTEQKDVTYTLFSDYSNQSVTSRELQESVSSAEISKNAEEEKDTEKESASYILYSFKAEKDGPVYVFDTSIPESARGLGVPAIKYVGTYQAGETVEGKFPLETGIGSGELLRGYCVNQVFAYADNEILAQYASLLNKRKISFNVVHENDLTGTFTAKKGQRILFTIPWDEGWTCFIDGRKVPIDKTWDLFMSIEVPEGQHTYEMKFFPAWMMYGIFLSVIAFLGMIVFLVLLKKTGNKYSVSLIGNTTKGTLDKTTVTDETSDNADLNRTSLLDEISEISVPEKIDEADENAGGEDSPEKSAGI